MKYVRYRAWIIPILVFLAIILLLEVSIENFGKFESDEPITDPVIIRGYPKLYDAIVQRDAQKLKPFLTDKNYAIRRQAWRALANTPVDAIRDFIQLAESRHSRASWLALSKHKLSKQQLRNLQKLWTQKPDARSGIARVLGRQGDKQSLTFLLKQIKKPPQPEFQFALAVGMLLRKFTVSNAGQLQIIRQAFSTDKDQTICAYLYAWYRGSAGALTKASRDTLYSKWQMYGLGNSPEVDQYINKIFKKRTTLPIAAYYNAQNSLNINTPLSVELAKSVASIPLNDNNELVPKILLTVANPHVKIQTLKSLKGKIKPKDDLYHYILQNILDDKSAGDMVWLQALRMVLAVNPKKFNLYQSRLEAILSKNNYATAEVLPIEQQQKSPEEYILLTKRIIEQGSAIPVTAVLQKLNEYWNQLQESQKTAELRTKIRQLTFQALALQDRGITVSAASLLMNSELFEKSDYKRIVDFLRPFSLPGDIEVYQTFGQVFKEEFASRAKSFIDSLADQHNRTLNKSFAGQGWNVDLSDTTTEKFRRPDWNRLWELGKHPVWVLETSKGTIDIRLNTLSAPLTISAIDSLSRAGAYDGVPFHRVVPNFVIQGGDIERGDGYGGPDFVLPTEASELGFGRGVMGIASAGTDTEGSQYFIMNQWSPHLNGNYTRLGKVITGMDVVDNIVVADSVITTGWK